MEVTFRHALEPGDIGALVWLHGILYAREQGWDHTFEAYVAGPLSEFARRNNPRERIWLVESDRVGQASSLSQERTESPPSRTPDIVGSIAIAEASPTEAQLRWFLLTPELRGKGVGRRLMDEALQFCREQGYSKVFLWTTSELTGAARLYRAAGFELTEEETHEIWGKVVTEQRYEKKLKAES